MARMNKNEETIKIFNDPWKFQGQVQEFKQTTAIQGYGSVASSGFSVEKGINTEMEINLKFKGISESSVEEFIEDFSKEQNKNLEYTKSLTQKNLKGGVRFSWGFLSLCDGKPYQQGYLKQKLQITKDSSDIQKLFYSKLNQKAESQLMLTGQISATGVSAIPRKAKVYAQMMQVKCIDGKSYTIISQNNAKIIDEKNNVCGALNNLKLIDSKSLIVQKQLIIE